MILSILLTSLTSAVVGRGKGIMRTRLAANPFMIRCVSDGAVTTIVPTRKRLAITEIEALFDEVLRQIELGHKDLVLDFSEVEWVCASTAGFLLELKRRLDRMGGSLKLSGVPEEMLQVLKLMHVDGRFEIIPAEAVPSLN